jgi:hypothetical protein
MIASRLAVSLNVLTGVRRTAVNGSQLRGFHVTSMVCGPKGKGKGSKSGGDDGAVAEMPELSRVRL